MAWTIHHGDCRDVMAKLDADSVDAIVSDPPYGLSFMGNGWDHGVPSVEFWTEAMRVAKPGAHLLAFGGTRTYHRLACAIEDADWEIRDCVMWVYGSGFPKSLDVSKAIDKAAGHWRGRSSGIAIDNRSMSGPNYVRTPKGDPVTAAAAAAAGFGTALKPAWEPIIVARKPLCGTVAENVLRHGTGAINVDGCRIGTNGEKLSCSTADPYHGSDGSQRTWNKTSTCGIEREQHTLGRWPANVIHDGSDEVVGLFPQAKGGAFPKSQNSIGTGRCHRGWQGNVAPPRDMGDSGSAARFFYCAKASKADRGGDNNHPTVKPTSLMRYLCRLVTPPGGVVLDPFTGSGSTGKAAVLEGFRFVGIEREAAYVKIAKARIAAAVKCSQPSLPF